MSPSNQQYGPIHRTADDRFRDLPGFPFAPHYVEDLSGYEGVRIHYVDEGPRDASVVWLCLHGEPTWAYLFRKMIPVFIAHGHRVIAPDFAGFGRSDKPLDEAVYTIDFHRAMVLALIERLDLRGLRLVCQDWGGLIGLTLPMAVPDRFSCLLVMNTTLGTGDIPLSRGFIEWRDYVRRRPDFDVAALMRRSTPVVSDAEAAAYGAPYPDASTLAGVRRFPELVPDRPDAPGAALAREARRWLSEDWGGRSLMAIGMKDPVLGPPVMRELHRWIRGCPAPIEIPEAGHFVQEWGGSIAERAVVSLG